MKYAILIDSNVQWFIGLATLDEEKNVLGFDAYSDKGVWDCEFFSNIFEREIFYYDIGFDNGTWHGWSISKREYEKTKQIMELYPKHKEFLSLSNSF
jgi:hypothetical protein